MNKSVELYIVSAGNDLAKNVFAKFSNFPNYQTSNKSKEASLSITLDRKRWSLDQHTY